MGNANRWLLATIAFALGATVGAGSLLIASKPPSTFTSSGSEWYSYVGGQQLVASISSPDLATSPTWSPGNPLPFRPEDAIALAQVSLGSMGPEVAAWSFSEIALHDEESNGRYFYTVSFQPKGGPVNISGAIDGAQLLVYFNGKVTLPVRSNRSAP